LVSGSHCCDALGVHLFLRRADGAFAERVKVRIADAKDVRGGGNARPHIVDWDRDGHTDLVIFYPGSAPPRGNQGRQRWTYLVGRGPLGVEKDLALKPMTLPPIPDAVPRCFTLADWDGDGRLDLLVGLEKRPVGERPDGGRWRVYWFRNTNDTGPPNFAEAAHVLDLPKPWELRALTAVDWAGDGRPSLVVSVSQGLKNLPGLDECWPVASELWLYRRKAEPRAAP
jgi:hypothetical protein